MKKNTRIIFSIIGIAILLCAILKINRIAKSKPILHYSQTLEEAKKKVDARNKENPAYVEATRRVKEHTHGEPVFSVVGKDIRGTWKKAKKKMEDHQLKKDKV